MASLWAGHEIKNRRPEGGVRKEGVGGGGHVPHSGWGRSNKLKEGGQRERVARQPEAVLELGGQTVNTCKNWTVWVR